MKITKQNSSVLIELSQAELSAIRFMAEMVSESTSLLHSIDPAMDPGPYHVAESLCCCSRFLRSISEHVEGSCSPHEFHEIGREFFELFMPEALGGPSSLG